MSLNDGFSETFIFHVKTDIFRVVINFTKGMCTVYTTSLGTPRGHILMRIEKLSQMDMNKIKKQINDYLEGRCNELPDFRRFPTRRLR